MKTSHFFPIALVTALFLPGMTKGLCPSITIDIPDIPSGCVGETVIVSPRLEEIAGNCNHMTTYPYKRWNWVVIGDNIVEPMAGNNIPAKFVTVRGGHGKIIFNLICRSRACPDCNRNFEVEKEFDVVHVAIEQGSLMVCGKDDWAYLNVTDDTHAPDGVVWTSRPHGIHGHGSSVSFRPSQLVPGAYTVKAANDGTPSCPDVCEVHVIKVNIPTTNIFVCAEDSLASLSLSGDSYSPGGYVWSSTPDGISGRGPDKTITFVPSNLPPGKYVVQCQSADLEDCLDECEVNVLSVDLSANTTKEVGKDDHYLKLKNSGDVIVTATLTPSVDPSVISWGGGTPGADNLQRIVSSGTPGDYDVSALVNGTVCKTIRIHVVDAIAPPANNAATLINTVGTAVPSGSFSPFGVMWGHRGGCGDPSPAFSVYLDGDKWILRVDSVTHVSRTGIQSGGRTDILGPTDSTLTVANFLAVMTDLTPPPSGTPSGPPRTSYWCSDITQSHENFHVDDFHNNYWTPRMQVFESWAETDAANILAYDCSDPNKKTVAGVSSTRQADVQNQVNTEHDAAWGIFGNAGWNETGAHNHSNPQYTARNNAIATRFGNPSVSISGPSSIGTNQNAIFTAVVDPPGGNYSWSGGGTPAAGNGTGFSTMWPSPGVNTITLIYSIPGGVPGSGSDSVIVQVTP